MNTDPLAQYRYQYLMIPKLREIIATDPIAIIPIGILEWHGTQNAFGMDGLVAEELCNRVMAQLKRGVLMPLHWVGTYGYVHYEGTICYDEVVTIQYLTQLLTQVVKLGFKLIFLISGHGGRWNQNAINQAVKNAISIIGKKPKEISIIGVVYPDLAEDVDITHAGPQETAMLWRIGEIKGVNLVDMHNHQSKPEKLPLYSLHNEAEVPIKEETLWKWDSIFPNANDCSPELGELVLSKISSGIFLEMQEYIDEMKI